MKPSLHVDIDVSVYPNGKNYVVEPHFPLQHLRIRKRSRLRVKIMSQNQNIPSKPQDSSMCRPKKPLQNCATLAVSCEIGD